MIPKQLVFKIIKQKALDFSFLTVSDMQKYPVQEHYLREVQETLVVYEFVSGNKNFETQNYINLLTIKLKRKYNAYSVEYIGSKVEEKTLQNDTTNRNNNQQ